MIWESKICSQAGGMAVARPYGFEIDFVRNPISGSTSWCLVIILAFILTPIFEINIHAKKSVTQKKISFWRQYLTPPAWELKVDWGQIEPFEAISGQMLTTAESSQIMAQMKAHEFKFTRSKKDPLLNRCNILRRQRSPELMNI